MAGWPKNRQASACFCNQDCPGPRRPYYKYLVGGIGTKFPFLNTELWLIEFVGVLPDLCTWSITDPPSGVTLTVVLEKDGVSGFEHAYRWSGFVSDLPDSDTFRVKHAWNDADLPVTPTLTPSCDAMFDMLNGDIIPKTLRIEPIPDWVCDQEQARAWRAGL